MKHLFKKLTALIWVFSITCAATGAAAGNGEPDASVKFILSGKNQTSEALLLSANADIDANAVVTAVTLSQTFKNNSDDWVEGQYLLPLPASAAVDKMTMMIGDKKIVGKIRKKAIAKKIYQAAVENGQKAALLQMNRDNLFTAKAGNIPPHGEVNITLHYVHPTDYDAGEFSLFLPTTFTPRFIVRNTLSEDNTENRLPEQHFAEKTGHKMTINARIDAGAKIDSIQSTSHSIDSAISLEDRFAEIHLPNGIAMNKDFKLRWKLADNHAPLALAFSEKTDKGYYTALRVVPSLERPKNDLARDMTLIIDTSGSMGGESIRQAKAGALAALDYLKPSDRFNLIEFNSDYSVLFPSSQQANAENINQARRFIYSLHANGGTQMYQPLDAALSFSNHGEYLRQIVFLTDGAVDNEARLFSLIQQKLDKTRLFTVAIGSAPNDFFMRQAAKAGRGDFTAIADITEVKAKMKKLFAKIQHPALTDISLKVADKTVESYPNPIPDVYWGRPIVSHLKTQTLPDNISLSAVVEGKAWQQSIKPTMSEKTRSRSDSALAKLWAREKVAQLIQSQRYDSRQSGLANNYDEQIENLGLDYQLITPRTAFVAVEEKLSRDINNQPLVKKAVNNQIPQGTMGFAKTATSSTLTAILGALLLLLAGFFHAINKPLNIVTARREKAVARNLLTRL